MISLTFSFTDDAIRMGTWPKVGDSGKKVAEAGKKFSDVEKKPFDGKRKNSGFSKNRSGFKKKRNQNSGKAYAANASGSSGGKTVCERCERQGHQAPVSRTKMPMNFNAGNSGNANRRGVTNVVLRVISRRITRN
ncbi:hypothetical protein L1987_20730 [Smallanthus sonchifolius]|uniref:Uncharacterized protein n=1 Tax=Smallanthus sonchifolius TaxID=185202 RepID=A0ACB9IU43_9ASTR|nr:hypothetical protein L1987_20730 [Smallanthus sonchifolius]